MAIKTVSKIDKAAMVTYIRCGMFFINPLISTIIYAAVTLGLFVMVLIGDIAEKSFSDTAVYSAMIALITALLLYMYFVLPKARWKRIAQTPKGETHMTFLEKSVHFVTFIGGEKRREGTAAYTDFVRFKESKRYFFIYVQRNQALIVRKDKLSGGTPDDLRAILKSFKSVKYSYIAL